MSVEAGIEISFVTGYQVVFWMDSMCVGFIFGYLWSISVTGLGYGNGWAGRVTM